MYVVTGAAGFIGSAVVWGLNRRGVKDILVVDTVDGGPRWRNLCNRAYAQVMDKREFLRRTEGDGLDALGITAILHLGASASTTERDLAYLQDNNTHYTRVLAEWAVARGARFIYASSAATYGDGSRGFSDADTVAPTLAPLNPYGRSKHDFDLWALEHGWTERIVGVKFFNVFGPNEYHKEAMASFVFKAFGQAQETGSVRLFRSLNPAYADGEQRRDFVYVKDCVDVVLWLLDRPEVNGIYNVGTGTARTWLDLVAALGSALDRRLPVEFVDLPPSIRDAYQYFTQAETGKLRAAGYHAPFASLEAAVADYVEYLQRDDPYL